jgi:hypothetical protein
MTVLERKKILKNWVTLALFFSTKILCMNESHWISFVLPKWQKFTLKKGNAGCKISLMD